MKKYLKFISILATVLLLASQSYGRYIVLGNQLQLNDDGSIKSDGALKASEFINPENETLKVTKSDVLQVNKKDVSFEVNADVMATDYQFFQVGGGSDNFNTFNMNFVDSKKFQIGSLVYAMGRTEDGTLNFNGDGSVDIGAVTFNAVTKEGVTTTWNFYQSGGLNFTGSEVTLANANIINVAKMSNSSAAIKIKGNSQLNIVGTQDAKTQNVGLGDITVNDTASFTMEVTGGSQSSIKSLNVASTASTSISATNDNGYIVITNASNIGTVSGVQGDLRSLSYNATTGDVSLASRNSNYVVSISGANFGSGLVSLTSTKVKNLSWDSTTKTANVKYAGAYTGTSISVGSGVTFTADNGVNTIEGAFVFENAKSVSITGLLYVGADKEFTVTGSEKSIKLSNGITTKENSILAFNSTNVLGTISGGSQKDVSISIARKGGVMDVYANNDFGSVSLSGYYAKASDGASILISDGHALVPTLEVAINGNDVSFVSITRSALTSAETEAGLTNERYVFFTDFVNNDGTENGKIKVTSDLAKAEDDTLEFIFAGTDYDNRIALYQWDDGSLHITATQVPEPAQWAMIFGAIALAFVAYRKRK